MVDISILTAASFMPGLQNSGVISGTASISGSLGASPNYSSGSTSNMINPKDGSGNPVPIIIQIPDTSMISLLRVNFPDASGDLANFWFPLIGTGVFTDNTLNWKLILYVLSHPEGRALYFNFVNLVNSGTTFTNFRINIYGHLYSYPWN